MPKNEKKQMLSYKFPLQLSKEQEAELLEWSDICAFAYNKLIDLQKDSPKRLSEFDMNRKLVEMKEQYPDLRKPPCMSLCDISRLVEVAFRRCRQKKARVPGRRKPGKFMSVFFLNARGAFKCDPALGTAAMPKLGAVGFAPTREMKGPVKIARISKSPHGKWLISFGCEYDRRLDVNPPAGSSIRLELDPLSDWLYEDSLGNKFDAGLKRRISVAKKISLFQAKIDLIAPKGDGAKAKRREELLGKAGKQSSRASRRYLDSLEAESKRLAEQYETVVVSRKKHEGELAKEERKHIRMASSAAFVELLKRKCKNVVVAAS